jgi:hypothetical protein
MLLRKDSENKVFNDIIEKKIKPVLTGYGFKHLPAKSRFEKGDKDFIRVISLAKGSLTFSEEEGQLYFTLHLYISIEHKLYEKWYEKEFKTKARLVHPIRAVSLIASIDFDLLSKDDFYEPSKAVAFKRQVAASLAKHMSQPDLLSLDAVLIDFKNYILPLEDLCDYRKLFAARPHPLQPVYVNLLLYYKDFDTAREVYKKNFETLCEEFEKAKAENSSHVSSFTDYFKEYKDIGERYLNIQFQIPAQPRFQSKQSNRTLNLNPTGLEYKEQFTLDKPFRKIITYAVNPFSGRVMVGHEGQVVTVWSATGDLLLQFDLIYPEGYDIMREYPVGYLPDADVFYANNYIITEDLKVCALEIPLTKAKNDKYKIHPRLEVPIAFCSETSQYIMLFSHLKKNFVLLYDTGFKLIKQFETEFRPLDILPKRKWIATYEYMKKIVLQDFVGNIVAELESNNASLGLGNVNYHDISRNENYLFSFFYNVKSALFSLGDFSKSTLWGHTTFEKDYKELYYNDINHNFGVAPARFAPDETYVVSGADHGKYVAWKLPSAERIELIPNADFLKKLPDALVYKIGNRTYLKNRGNGIRDIRFFKAGAFFTTLINDDILVWDRDFVHHFTIENIGKIIPFTDEYLLIYKDNALSLFRNI